MNFNFAYTYFYFALMINLFIIIILFTIKHSEKNSNARSIVVSLSSAIIWPISLLMFIVNFVRYKKTTKNMDFEKRKSRASDDGPFYSEDTDEL